MSGSLTQSWAKDATDYPLFDTLQTTSAIEQTNAQAYSPLPMLYLIISGTTSTQIFEQVQRGIATRYCEGLRATLEGVTMSSQKPASPMGGVVMIGLLE